MAHLHSSAQQPPVAIVTGKAHLEDLFGKLILRLQDSTQKAL
jgi:hypothetical protein